MQSDNSYHDDTILDSIIMYKRNPRCTLRNNTKNIKNIIVISY